MSRYDINQEALEAALGSSFEKMIWYAFYVITETEEEEELRSAYKEQIEEIINAAAFHGYEKRKIDDLTLPNFIFIIETIQRCCERKGNRMPVKLFFWIKPIILICPVDFPNI
jgi:hypothetical protein